MRPPHEISRLHRTGAALGLWLCLGCGTLSLAQTARPADPGAVQATLEPAYILTRSEGTAKEQILGGVSVRCGVTEGVDVGLRAGVNVLPELVARWQVLGDDAGLALTLAPGVGAYYDALAAVPDLRLFARPALLLGVPLLGFSDLTLGVQSHVIYGVRPSTGVWGSVLTPAASVALHFYPFEWLAVGPELAVGWSALYLGTGPVQVGGAWGAQGGVVVVLGGKKGWRPW